MRNIGDVAAVLIASGTFSEEPFEIGHFVPGYFVYCWLDELLHTATGKWPTRCSQPDCYCQEGEDHVADVLL